ncbi:MAG: hypothetical protein KatS3mg012_1989 [Gaiellaceae bacterium]|nr:MAG: hypothetical protein KatS3mg012_1989 [Gaiellaceae bacterium]
MTRRARPQPSLVEVESRAATSPNDAGPAGKQQALRLFRLRSDDDQLAFELFFACFVVGGSGLVFVATDRIVRARGTGRARRSLWASRARRAGRALRARRAGRAFRARRAGRAGGPFRSRGAVRPGRPVGASRTGRARRTLRPRLAVSSGRTRRTGGCGDGGRRRPAAPRGRLRASGSEDEVPLVHRIAGGVVGYDPCCAVSLRLRDAEMDLSVRADVRVRESEAPLHPSFLRFLRRCRGLGACFARLTQRSRRKGHAACSDDDQDPSTVSDDRGHAFIHLSPHFDSNGCREEIVGPRPRLFTRSGDRRACERSAPKSRPRTRTARVRSAESTRARSSGSGSARRPRSPAP